MDFRKMPIAFMKNSILFFVSAFIIFSSVKAQPGCPNVNAGNNQTLPCNTNCTNLTATFLQTGATTSYGVSSIPYAPPYAYNTGTAIMVNIDDRWSSVISLPFTFCFFGNVYTQIVVGSNGLITFNTANSGNFCPWSYSVTCPSANLPTNAIFGPYHDIDPSVSGTLRYAILGSYPCRTFVINFHQVAMYSCTSLKATHQIVLYESTNVIEVYMQNKPLCSSWNGGRAIVGIQNNAGNVGYTAPGRNSTQWTATNEAWRFTPNGPANYTLTWFQGTSQIGNTATINVCPTQNTTYTAQVVYNNCNGSQVIVTDNVVVNKTVGPTVTVTPANSNVCLGASQSLTASGATTYSWSPSSGLSSTTGATVTATPTTNTTYTVTGTANGCIGTATAVINISGGPAVSLTSFNSICATAPAFALSGGTPSGGTYSGPGVSNGMFNPQTAGQGTHTITYSYTDTQGCIGQATQSITVFSTIPANAGNDQIVCQGQSVNLTAFGGVSYVWSNNSQTQSINVTPATSTNYTVTVTDNIGCTGTDDVYVTVHPLPNANAGSPVNICMGTSTQLNASGGTIYAWSPATGLSSASIANPVASPTATTTYIVTVTNQNGCSATSSVAVNVKPLPIVNITGNNASCSGINNASATANVTSGSTPFQYAWSTTPLQSTQTANNLTPGVNYIVTVTDMFGCTATSAITLTTPTPIVLNFTKTNAQCYGSADGTATAIVSGGTPPYNYIWLPTGTAGNVNTLNTLSQGNYTLQITDANNCPKDTSFVITQPPQITYTQNVSNVNCYNGNNGSISVQVLGGTAPLNYAWSCGTSTTSTVSNLCTGQYILTITDAHLCDSIVTFNVTQPQQLIVTPSPNASYCLGQNYNISASATGGTPPYTYNWDNNLPPLPSHSFTAQQTITYNVSVSDANNCTSPSYPIVITIAPPLSVSLAAVPSTVCAGTQSILTASASGGNGAPYNYQWSTSGQGSSITVNPQQTTTFYVTVTDNCGSPPAVAQVPVMVFPVPPVNFTADIFAGCQPLLIHFLPSVNPAPSSYNWNFGDPSSGIFNQSSAATPVHMYNEAGLYDVMLTIQTVDGCTTSSQINNMIEVYPLPVADFYTDPLEADIENPVIEFFNTSTGASSWFWWFDNSASGNNNVSVLENPTHVFTDVGLYQIMLIAETQNGCKDTIYRPLRIKDIFAIYIPNAFTPNGDGINDNFIPVFTGVQSFEMFIFNRWGEMIFTTDNTSNPWDGTVKNGSEIAMTDVYSYVIMLVEVSGKKHRYIGHVTLLKSDSY